MASTRLCNTLSLACAKVGELTEQQQQLAHAARAAAREQAALVHQVEALQGRWIGALSENRRLRGDLFRERLALQVRCSRASGQDSKTLKPQNPKSLTLNPRSL